MDSARVIQGSLSNVPSEYVVVYTISCYKLTIAEFEWKQGAEGEQEQQAT